MSIARRGASISTQFSPARTVVERRRPEISPSSPKNSPFSSATIAGLPASPGSRPAPRRRAPCRTSWCSRCAKITSPGLGVELALEHELAQLQAVRSANSGTLAWMWSSTWFTLDPAQTWRTSPRAAARPRAATPAEGELDHLVALVHRLLDERVAAERADDVEARHVRLVAGETLGTAVGIVAREQDAEALDQLARRHGAQARDDAVALDHVLALGSAAKASGLSAPSVDSTRAPRGAVAALDAFLVHRRGEQREVALLAARELLVAVDEDHAVVARRARARSRSPRRRRPPPRWSRSVLVRIVELVLDAQVLARHAELAQVALQADGEHDALARESSRPPRLHLEGAVGAGDGDDLGVGSGRSPCGAAKPRSSGPGPPRACRPRTAAGCAAAGSAARPSRACPSGTCRSCCEGCASASSSTCATPSSAACAAPESPAGPSR